MKRGRPDSRSKIKPLIVEAIKESRVPVGVNTIKKTIDKGMKQPVSWNTIKKYLDELVQTDTIQPITLPHSKIEKKDGLTVYTIKR